MNDEENVNANDIVLDLSSINEANHNSFTYDYHISSGGMSDTITLSDPLSISTISLNNASVMTTGTITGAGLDWNNRAWDNSLQVESNGKLSLTGDNADIDINGVSLVDTLKGIQERLNILTPNTKLEAEWDQLRELGEQYRELEKKLTEQSKMWDTLKKMPPPEIE